jgi:hypothetical protein
MAEPLPLAELIFVDPIEDDPEHVKISFLIVPTGQAVRMRRDHVVAFIGRLARVLEGKPSRMEVV